MAYDNNNTGLLARNKRKEKEEHPSHTGSINVEGKEYWLSAWVKEGKEGSKLAGEKFFSLAIKAKDTAQRNIRPVSAQLGTHQVQFEEDQFIPF